MEKQKSRVAALAKDEREACRNASLRVPFGSSMLVAGDSDGLSGRLSALAMLVAAPKGTENPWFTQ